MKFEDLDLENVQNIEEGMVFKNRRELCEYLGVEYVKGGNAIKKQLRMLENIFEYEKRGHRFIVKSKKPMAYIELGFKLSTDRQKQISELLILNLILGSARGDDDTLIINQNVLISYLALANKNYIRYYHNRNNELAKKLGISRDSIKVLDGWMRSVRSSLQYSIDSAIDQLEKEGFIMHNKVYKVQTVRQQNEIHVISMNNEYGDEQTDYGTSHSEIKKNIRLATNSETNIILDIEKEVLEDMDMSKRDLLLQGRFGEFNQKCRDMTIKTIGVGFYFLCHKFNYAESFIKKKKEEVIEQLKNENIDELKYELNNMMCNRIDENSKRRAKEKIEGEVVNIEDMSESERNLWKDTLDEWDKESLNETYTKLENDEDIEQALKSFLLVVDDLNEDIGKVWFDVFE